MFKVIETFFDTPSGEMLAGKKLNPKQTQEKLRLFIVLEQARHKVVCNMSNTTRIDKRASHHYLAMGKYLIPISSFNKLYFKPFNSAMSLNCS